jgi:hypothetical protein
MLCFLVWGIYLLTSKNARALQRKENMCFKDAESGKRNLTALPNLLSYHRAAKFKGTFRLYDFRLVFEMPQLSFIMSVACII